MKNLEKLHQISQKIKSIKKTSLNFTPRQILGITINNNQYFAGLICNENFEVKVVLLDNEYNIVDELLSVASDRASLVKTQNYL